LNILGVYLVLETVFKSFLDHLRLLFLYLSEEGLLGDHFCIRLCVDITEVVGGLHKLLIVLISISVANFIDIIVVKRI
jgi:hypothetical protein